MKLSELKPPKGATHSKKRRGLGTASGNGKTAGRGEKGQKSRSGYSRRFGFEGGQMPLIRRIPKRGFTNVNKIDYQVVNVEKLNIFNDGDTVTRESLREVGCISKVTVPVKILGNGEITKKIHIKVDRITPMAKKKIEEKGGTVEVKLD